MRSAQWERVPRPQDVRRRCPNGLLSRAHCADHAPERLVQRRFVLNPPHDDEIVVPIDVDDVRAVADETHRRRGRFGEGPASEAAVMRCSSVLSRSCRMRRRGRTLRLREGADPARVRGASRGDRMARRPADPSGHRCRDFRSAGEARCRRHDQYPHADDASVAACGRPGRRLTCAPPAVRMQRCRKL